MSPAGELEIMSPVAKVNIYFRRNRPAMIKRWPLKLPALVKCLLAPYFPGLDLEAIRIHEGIPWYVPKAAVAYTDCYQLYFAPSCYDPYSVAGLALLGHELTHSLQYQTWGKWRFRASYSCLWALGLLHYRSFEQAYGYNWFEVEARAMERRLYRDLVNRNLSCG
jgi:hypothetical protein